MGFRAGLALIFKTMTTSPNPTLSLTSIDGTERSLDDWTTVFTQLWIVLPSKAEAKEIIPVAEQIFKTFGDSDARCAYLIPGNEVVAKRLMGMTTIPTQCFIDPDFKVCDALGITKAPSLVYIQQDTSVAFLAEGFDIENWTTTVEQIAKAQRWTTPQLGKFKDLPSQSYSIK